MNVIVQSKTFVVTEAIRAFVSRHLTKVLRQGGRVSQVLVFLESIPKKKNDLTATTAKIYVDLPGKNIVVQERAQDLYVAITEAAHSAARQLRKLRERRHSHRGQRFALS